MLPEWGRIDAHGQIRLDLFRSHTEAEDALLTLENRKRRGDITWSRSNTRCCDGPEQKTDTVSGLAPARPGADPPHQLGQIDLKQVSYRWYDKICKRGALFVQVQHDKNTCRICPLLHRQAGPYENKHRRGNLLCTVMHCYALLCTVMHCYALLCTH